MHAKLLNKNQTNVINHQDEKTAIEYTDKNKSAIEEPKLTDTQSTRKINQTLLKCDLMPGAKATLSKKRKFLFQQSRKLSDRDNYTSVEIKETFSHHKLPRKWECKHQKKTRRFEKIS